MKINKKNYCPTYVCYVSCTVFKEEPLSKLFVNFLENESSPRVAPPTTATPLPGYVDSRTDPDRPSLATAALTRPPPLKVDSPANQIPASRLPRDTAQSSILDSVLNN